MKGINEFLKHGFISHLNNNSHILDIMSDENLKIDELRACFERENSRKESLQNKASYFLGIISVIITIICSYLSIFMPKFNLNFINILLLILLIFSFSISIGLCLRIFFPKKYAHPFDFENYKKFENSFKKENEAFKNELQNQYLISIYTNHQLNDKICFKINISIISFIIFIVLFVILVILL